MATPSAPWPTWRTRTTRCFDSTLRDTPRVTRGYDDASSWTRQVVPCSGDCCPVLSPGAVALLHGYHLVTVVPAGPFRRARRSVGPAGLLGRCGCQFLRNNHSNTRLCHAVVDPRPAPTGCFAHKCPCFVCMRPGVCIVILGCMTLLVLPTDPLRVTAHV